MRRPIRNYLLCFTIRYRRLLPSKKIGTLVGESSSSGSLAMLLAIRRASRRGRCRLRAWPPRASGKIEWGQRRENGAARQSKAATATDYCFGGNCVATCIGLDETRVETCAECSCVETCAGCCVGFGGGVWTGLSARGETGLAARGEDESREMLCWEICSWI